MKSRLRITIAVLSPLALAAVLAGAPPAVGDVGQASAVTPKAGAWKGRTADGENLSFRVSGKYVTKFTFRWSAVCDVGEVSATTKLAKLRIRKGRFALTNTTTTVKGAFTSKKRAKGTLRVQQRIFNGVNYSTCDTGRVAWTAKRR